MRLKSALALPLGDPDAARGAKPSRALLAVSRTGGSLGKDFVSARPKLCTVQLRADDKPSPAET
jgi:hypothetical protein